ncbi:MAG: helix-turn-helix domain-containing protein, partial [Pikeienuella sp.]
CSPQIGTIRAARIRANVSLKDAADHLGVTKATMSRIETGIAGITADRIIILAKLYGVTVAEIFGEE